VLLPLPEGPIMETASPLERVREIPDRIERVPRGAGYSLARLVTSSNVPTSFQSIKNVYAFINILR
jgi:hypothetical protein